MQQHVAVKLLHRINLDRRRAFRHDNHGVSAERGCRECYALRVVASRARDNAGSELLARQLCDLIVRAADLEREDGLQVLTLDQDRVSQPRREDWRTLQRL